MLVPSKYFILKSTRQHPKWTYHQAIFNISFRKAFYYMTITKFPLPPISMKLGAEQERFVLMESEDGIYKGILQNSAIEPATAGGTCYPKLFQFSGEITVILHFHSGSFL